MQTLDRWPDGRARPATRAISHSSYKHQQHNPGVTEIVEIPGRGHALTIDSGWREGADICLQFVQRFVAADGSATSKHEPAVT